MEDLTTYFSGLLDEEMTGEEPPDFSFIVEEEIALAESYEACELDLNSRSVIYENILREHEWAWFEENQARVDAVVLSAVD